MRPSFLTPYLINPIFPRWEPVHGWWRWPDASRRRRQTGISRAGPLGASGQRSLTGLHILPRFNGFFLDTGGVDFGVIVDFVGHQWTLAEFLRFWKTEYLETTV